MVNSSAFLPLDRVFVEERERETERQREANRVGERQRKRQREKDLQRNQYVSQGNTL